MINRISNHLKLMFCLLIGVFVNPFVVANATELPPPS